MGTDQESGSTKLQTLAAIATILALLVAVLQFWYDARKSSEVQIESRPAPALEKPAPGPALDESTGSSPQPIPVHEANDREPPRLGKSPPAPQPLHQTGETDSSNVFAVPIEFTLQNGEQRTILSDQVSLAAEFTRIQTEEIVTLTINTVEGQPTSHAILGSRDRFEFTSAGEDYFVYVLRMDPEAETVHLRVARAL